MKYNWYQRQLLHNSKSKRCKSSFLDNSLFHPNRFHNIDDKFKFFLHFNPIFLLCKMGNRRNRKSRRLATPSPAERETSEVRVETPSQGSETLTKVNLQSQESLGEIGLRPKLVEPSQVSNEIQAWTKIFEQKTNDRITKMREEMENKLYAIPMEIKTI